MCTKVQTWQIPVLQNCHSSLGKYGAFIFGFVFSFVNFLQLREYAVKLKELVDKKCTDADIKEVKLKMMTEVGRFV